MNTPKEKALLARQHHNPFWVCLAVFLALGADTGFRLDEQLKARREMRQMQSGLAENAARLPEARRIEATLQLLSVDLVQLARTNAAAADIVREFNIQWSPGPAAPSAPTP
jgi:hypothetical protein